MLRAYIFEVGAVILDLLYYVPVSRVSFVALGN